MSILYGTVEYFEKQIENYLAVIEDIRTIYNVLENEILNDHFIDDENIRNKFLDNLDFAIERMYGIKK